MSTVTLILGQVGVTASMSVNAARTRCILYSKMGSTSQILLTERQLNGQYIKASEKLTAISDNNYGTHGPTAGTFPAGGGGGCTAAQSSLLHFILQVLLTPFHR